MFDVERAGRKSERQPKSPKRKRQLSSLSSGCIQCNGRSWVTVILPDGQCEAMRCACERGRYLAALNRKRRAGGRS